MFNYKSEQKLFNYQSILKQKIDNLLVSDQKHHLLLFSRLDDLSPLKVMQRGYTLIKKDNHIVKKANDLKSGDMIDIIFSDDSKKAIIK